MSASKLVWAARREDLADAPFLAGDRGRSGVAESAELDAVRVGGRGQRLRGGRRGSCRTTFLPGVWAEGLPLGLEHGLGPSSTA